MVQKKKVTSVSELGRLGGKARAKKLTKEQLSEIGKKGGKAGGRGRPKKK